MGLPRSRVRGSDEGNPFADVRLSAVFRRGDERIEEDEAIVALADEYALEDLSYEVETAASGEAALRAFAQDTGFDLALMDIDLGLWARIEIDAPIPGGEAR